MSCNFDFPVFYKINVHLYLFFVFYIWTYLFSPTLQYIDDLLHFQLIIAYGLQFFFVLTQLCFSYYILTV